MVCSEKIRGDGEGVIACVGGRSEKEEEEEDLSESLSFWSCLRVFCHVSSTFLEPLRSSRTGAKWKVSLGVADCPVVHVLEILEGRTAEGSGEKEENKTISPMLLALGLKLSKDVTVRSQRREEESWRGI